MGVTDAKGLNVDDVYAARPRYRTIPHASVAVVTKTADAVAGSTLTRINRDVQDRQDVGGVVCEFVGIGGADFP